MLKIGSLSLKSNLILSPMAGISDLPFRALNRRFGAELAFVEMINARSASYKNKKTRQMLKSTAQDQPLGVQLLGCEPKFISQALEALQGCSFDILDFNAACPAKKVVRRGEGAALLREPKKLKQILRLVVKNSSLPVTVKIRIGWDRDSINAREVALHAQDSGVSGIFIHGRTKLQGYSGGVDYQAIRKVKESLEVPVIASGNILSAELAARMLGETGCDGLAVARGALGNPWIFREIAARLEGDGLPGAPDKKEIAQVMAGHLKECVDFYGERVGVVIFRKFFAWYTRGFRKVRPLRERSSRARTQGEMLSIIRQGCGSPND